MAPSPNDPVAEPGPADPSSGNDAAGDPLAALRRAVAEPSPWSLRLAQALGPWRSGAAGRLDRHVVLALVAIGAVVVALLVGGGLVLGRDDQSRPGSAGDVAASLPRAGTGTTTGTSLPEPGGVGGTTGATGSAGGLIVQAAGAVVRPGVYHLPAGSRVGDLIAQAGGLTPDADGDRVNLASPLADGVRVWVPRRGETDPPVPVDGGGGAGGGAAPGVSSPPALVDLNTATADELEALPGVGPATAAAIIDYRQRNGPFHSVDDLAQVRGIGDAKLAQLRDLVRV